MDIIRCDIIFLFLYAGVGMALVKTLHFMEMR